MNILLWFFKRLFLFFEYPIKKFLAFFDKNESKTSTGKMLLLFTGALAGTLLIGGTFLWLIGYVLTYYFEWVVIVGIILLFVDYVKSTMENKNSSQDIAKKDSTPLLSDIQKQAEDGYSTMRQVVYTTAKEIASEIGVVSPRSNSEVEFDNDHYIIGRGSSEGICFYQFKLTKADPKKRYTISECADFRDIFEKECSFLIESGYFPGLSTDKEKDNYNKWHSDVCIELIEDVGRFLYIYMVYYDSVYSEYRHKIELEAQERETRVDPPDASWNI